MSFTNGLETALPNPYIRVNIATQMLIPNLHLVHVVNLGAGAVNSALLITGVSTHKRSTDVEKELWLGGIFVGDMIVVLVSPQLCQTEHLITFAHITQDLVRNVDIS